MGVPISSAFDWTLHEYASLPSTMDEARRIARPQTVIWAHTQTQGRGRQGRTWVSNLGNLYCSVLIDPQMSAPRWGELSFVAAVAVGETVQTYLSSSTILGHQCANDLFIDNQKVAGILLETCTEGQTERPLMIIGFGINIVSCPFQTLYPSTYLQKVCAHPLPTIKMTLARLIQNLVDTLNQWQEEGFEPVRQRWLQRACFLDQPLSLKTKFHNQQVMVEGLFKGIDRMGKILLQTPNDGMKSFSTGDVFFDGLPVDLKDDYASDH